MSAYRQGPAPAAVRTLPDDATGLLTQAQREIAELQRSRGRAGLESAELAALGELFESVADEPGEESEVLRLLTRPFSRALAVPEYYQYTCSHVYHWFLDQTPDDPVGAALLALHTTLTDLLYVERAAWPEEVRPQHTTERIKRLQELVARVRNMPVDTVGAVTVGDLVDRAALDPALGRKVALLAECTRFPRSDQHEEHVFLRVVQSSESVFFLVRRVATEVASACRADPAEAARLLALAGDCADVLNSLFHVLLTLSPQGFMTFREQTGQASAVQSLNYNAMDISVYGFDPRKAQTYDSVPHLRVLNSPAVRDHKPLSAVVADSGDGELMAGWQRLDRTLSKWRGAHYRFARTYLPVGTQASGGTDGAAFVKRFVKKDACVAGEDAVGARELLSGFFSR